MQRHPRPKHTYKSPARQDAYLPQKDANGEPVYRPIGWTPYQEDKRRHGGHRPGAGAPRGNTNAMKTGAHSKRYERALYMMAAVPELRFFVQVMDRRGQKEDRKRIRALYAAALYASTHDPELEKTIKNLVYSRLADVRIQLQKKQAVLKMLRALKYNQTIKRPRRPIQYRNRPSNGRLGWLYVGPNRRAAAIDIPFIIHTRRAERADQAIATAKRKRARS